MADVKTIMSFEDMYYNDLDGAKRILDAYMNSGVPSDFDDYNEDGYQIMSNPYSGNVFLTNEECQVAMVCDDGKLHSWYWLPYNGNEGFADDLYEEFKDGYIDEEDLEELKNIFETSEDAKEGWAEEVQQKIDEIR